MDNFASRHLIINNHSPECSLPLGACVLQTLPCDVQRMVDGRMFWVVNTINIFLKCCLFQMSVCLQPVDGNATHFRHRL